MKLPSIPPAFVIMAAVYAAIIVPAYLTGHSSAPEDTRPAPDVPSPSVEHVGIDSLRLDFAPKGGSSRAVFVARALVGGVECVVAVGDDNTSQPALSCDWESYPDIYELPPVDVVPDTAPEDL